jgi:hypothetical protein
MYQTRLDIPEDITFTSTSVRTSDLQRNLLRIRNTMIEEALLLRAADVCCYCHSHCIMVVTLCRYQGYMLVATNKT